MQAVPIATFWRISSISLRMSCRAPLGHIRVHFRLSPSCLLQSIHACRRGFIAGVLRRCGPYESSRGIIALFGQASAQRKQRIQRAKNFDSINAPGGRSGNFVAAGCGLVIFPSKILPVAAPYSAKTKAVIPVVKQFFTKSRRFIYRQIFSMRAASFL